MTPAKMSSGKYSIIITEDGQTRHSIKWQVPNFNNFLKTNASELYPEISNEPIGDSDTRFKIKMQNLGNNLIGIYYLSPTPTLVQKSFLSIIRYSKPGDLFFHELNEKTLRTHDPLILNTVVEVNKWNRLCICNNSVLPSDWYTEETFLKIEFIVKNIKFHRIDSPEEQLSNDFENLLNDTLFYDVTMKSAEGDEYKVHKAVLASRSAVLKAHFEHNTTECVTNIVDSQLESELLREVLTFIYSGKAPHLDEIPEKLLAAANYYQLSGLISLCEEALHKKLTVENALETLQLADLHSANELKLVTLEFIKDRKAIPQIIKTEGWAKLKPTELIKEILEYMA